MQRPLRAIATVGMSLGMCVWGSVVVISYLMPTQARDDGRWVQAKLISNLQEGSFQLLRFDEGYVNVTRINGAVIALEATCPHLGVSLAWDVGEQNFVCSAHGERFSRMGTHLSGPSLRSLKKFRVRETAGRLEIRF